MLDDTTAKSPETTANTALKATRTRKLRPLKLTVKVIDRLEPGATARDTEVKGLRVECGRTGTKRFRFKTDVREGDRGGAARAAKTVNMTLGAYPAMTLEEARVEAVKLRQACRSGQDPRQGTARDRTLPTVDALFELYIEDWCRAPKMIEPGDSPEEAQRCSEGYIARLLEYRDRYLSNWRKLPVASVTAEMAIATHKHVTRNSGPVVANEAMRAFNRCYQWARKKRRMTLTGDCAIEAVSYNPQEPRTDRLVLLALDEWYRRAMTIRNPIRRQMQIFCLFSGLRKSNLMGMLRAWIDFEQRAVIFPWYVMKSRRPFSLPLSDFMIVILRRALEEGDKLYPGSPYVFPTRSREGKVIATRDIKERDVRSLPVGHIVRHMYATHCELAGVAERRRELLLDHRTKKDIKGLYLHVPTLFGKLLKSQERMSRYLIQKTGAA